MNNFKNTRWLFIITVILLTANIITLVLLWTKKDHITGEMKPPPSRGQVFEFLNQELNLDAQQQEAFKKLRDEHQAAAKGIQDNIRKAKDDFFDLLKKPDISDSLINVYSRRAVEADQKLDKLTFRHFQKMRAICNADQQKKFDSIIQEALHRMGPPKRPGPPPGMQPEEGPPPPGN